MPAPRPILKLSDPDPSYVAASALPFTESRGFDTPHVHFPPTPIMTSTAITHSPSIYDRAPIVVSQNVCELPERGGRAFIPDLPAKASKRPGCKRSNTGYFHPNARGSDDTNSFDEDVASSPPPLLPMGLNDLYNYHNQLQQGRNPTAHHRPPPLIFDHGSDGESPMTSSISHISIRHYSACSVPTSRSVSPTHTASGSSSTFVSCPPSPSMTSDVALSARMVGLSLGITSSTTSTTMTATATTTTLMKKDPKRASRSRERSRELERDRDRQSKREHFNGEDGEPWTADGAEDSQARTSTSKSRRRRLSASSASSFQEPALEGCLGGF
ncbi:hypothetical protein CVT24_000938 [Panaeolus cyanescens]|uniref:Uncharacterized protein n=1 Tax=Panaeolus cyanescens TaxID=181874 RepID=A0A409YTB0_9AGAR|nr:hypothetical protein CVT24_000938 [Panaeolus cyanescens]